MDTISVTESKIGGNLGSQDLRWKRNEIGICTGINLFRILQL
jgi:hypothetical protein